MRWFVPLAFCAACGGENASADAAVEDADVVAIDAPSDARVPTCAGATFQTSAAVNALNTPANETFLRLAADELTAYFARQDPDETLFYSTRSSTTAPFSVPVKLPITGNGTLETTSPTVTADGLTLYFTSSRTGTLGGRDIWRATRAATTTNFGSITAMTGVNTDATENDVFVLPDHSAIYFSSNRNAVYRIYRAARLSTGAFAPPEEVFNASPADANRVVVAPGELTMLYATASDLRLSTRASTSVSWLPGVALTAIDSEQLDIPTWISPDLCRLYYGSNRSPSGSGDQNFRVAIRAPQ